MKKTTDFNEAIKFMDDRRAFYDSINAEPEYEVKVNTVKHTFKLRSPVEDVYEGVDDKPKTSINFSISMGRDFFDELFTLEPIVDIELDEKS